MIPPPLGEKRLSFNQEQIRALFPINPPISTSKLTPETLKEEKKRSRTTADDLDNNLGIIKVE